MVGQGRRGGVSVPGESVEISRKVSECQGVKVSECQSVKEVTKEDVKLRRKIHQTIKKVTEDLDGGFHFNTAISAVMELVNEAYERIGQLAEGAALEGVIAEAVEATVMLLSPFVPHIAEEMWRKLGSSGSIFRASWPSYDRTALSEETVIMVIQVNGKVRSKIEVPSDMKEDKVKEAALSDPKIQPYTKDKAVRQVVVVPKKLANIVV